MEFRALGPLEVRDEGAPVGLGGAKQRALLAVLLLNANSPSPASASSTTSGASASPTARARWVQIDVHQLRRTVTDRVAGSGLRFEPRGKRELAGLPGAFTLFEVTS